MNPKQARLCRCGHRHYPGPCSPRICGCGSLRPDPRAAERKVEVEVEVEHGTTAGYRAHSRYGMPPPCDECLKANATYHRARRQRLRDKPGGEDAAGETAG